MIRSILFSFVLILPSALFAEWHPLNSSEATEPQFHIEKVTEQSIELRVELSGFHKESVVVNGQEFTRIDVPGLSHLGIKGSPALPRISKDLMVPAGTTSASVEILEQEIEDIEMKDIISSRGTIYRNQDPAKIPYTFNEVYASSEFFPKEIASVSKPFVLRDVKGVNLEFIPFQYNAAKQRLRVVRSVQLRISTAYRGEFQTFITDNRLEQSFQRFYENHFLNFKATGEAFRRFEGEDSTEPYWIAETGKLLIISHPQFVHALRPFVAWKTRRGLDVRLVGTDEISENVTDVEIKAFIQQQYDEREISYVILVGDAEFVPPHNGVSGNAAYNEADPMYALVDGDDHYPDLFVSRFSVKTLEDLENTMARNIAYERSPDLAGGWYSQGTGVASSEGGWSGMTDAERADVVRDLLLDWGYASIDQIYEPNDEKQYLIDALNEGRGFINYIGHGSSTSWGTTGFSNYDIDALENGHKMPFIVSVACVNGNFDYAYGDSFAERWVKAGTAEEPKGAIGVFASSTNQAWIPPTIGQKRITELLVADQFNTLGALLFHGSVAVLEDASAEAEQTFETWHIFGDATLQVRSRLPQMIDAKSETEIDPAQKFLEVEVAESGITGALLAGERLVGTAISDESGILEIELDQDELRSTDEFRLVMTGYNRVPEERVLRVK